MGSSLITPFVAVFGILIGALMNAFFTSRSQKSKMQNELKYEAYKEFVESVALSQGSIANSPEKWDGFRLSLRSRQKIALIGSKEVVRALSKLAPKIHNWSDEIFPLFRDVIICMREDLQPNNQGVFEAEIGDILFDLGGRPQPKENDVEPW